MRILISTGLYPPEIGGPATYTVLLEKSLPAHGHQVEAIAFSHSRKYPRVLRHFHFFFTLIKRGRKDDIFFAQDTVSVGLPTVLAAKLLRKKIFVRVPGDYAWEQSVQRFSVQESIDEFQKKKYSFKVELLRTLQRFVVRQADVVITPSDYFRTLVIGWGVRPENVFTIYNGVNLDIIPKPAEKPAPLTIVSAGRLVPWKGFVTLIKAMRELPSWHLVILGNGPQREELESLISDLHLEDRVHLKGAVSREEVFGWCEAADVFVLNTHFESFSYQIVEAMSAGIPVITTNVGSLPELITTGEEGILIPPDDIEKIISEIRSVVTQKSIWQERTKKARQKASQFSIKNTMQHLHELISRYE